jgi:hypothetical protein
MLDRRPPGRPDAGRLVRAYDDAAGVIAAFNRNVLAVLNRELGATFDETAFEHVAPWDDEQEWIEMRLRSRGEQVVRVAALDLDVAFAAGGDADGGLGEVPPGGGRSRARRGGPQADALVDRPRWRLRRLDVCPWLTGATSERDPRGGDHRLSFRSGADLRRNGASSGSRGPNHFTSVAA